MASSSSSLKRERSYDVFLSFRGTDVRNNFLSHLYTALYQNGISTYIDSEEMRKGDQIRPALMKAIEESQFAIIIFSKDYASSSWCLEEVAKIMECKTQKDLIVLPVFYKVEPREVRWGRGSYGRAMAKHESDFGKDSHKVKRWKKALYDASELSGWTTLNDEVEAEIVKKIVKDISMQIDQRPVHVAEHLIGIHPRLIELNSMLKLGSDEDVRMIGLWGPGGIGKTTLGSALYNNFSRQFEGSCFLADVCKALEGPKDLAALQKQLLSEILPGRRLVVFDVRKGISLMQNNLYRKKVLLVLDNVTDRSQLDALAGNLEWFGAGSRIIFTTRDKHLLISHRIKEDYIFEVKPLDDHDAFELLRGHAFPSNINIRRALVDRVLRYANGHPLTLVQLGRFLYCRSEREWESSLNILGKILKNPSNDTFKWSYDGLDDNAKEICLDIACFFRGYSKEYTMKVLDSCNFESTIGVKVLAEKSFITEEGGTLQISNNMIQLMAMDSVRQEYPTRLWLLDDFRNVLSGHLVATALQSIVLILPEPEKINIGPNALTNLRRLKKLIMKNVHNSFQDPIYLPNELKWFEWPECHPCITESSSGPEESTQLALHESNIQALNKQFEGPKKLESNNFSECPSLVFVSIFDWTPNRGENISYSSFEAPLLQRGFPDSNSSAWLPSRWLPRLPSRWLPRTPARPSRWLLRTQAPARPLRWLPRTPARLPSRLPSNP